MKLDISEIDVWTGTIPDEPGALAGRVAALADAGENLEFMFARPSSPGTAVIFMAPIVHAKDGEVIGLSRAADLHALRVEAPNRRGLGAEMLRLIAADGINVRGLTAAVIGERSVTYLAFHDASEAKKARTTLELDL